MQVGGDFLEQRGPGVAGICERGEVTTGAEHLALGADHHDAHVGILVGSQRRIHQVLRHLQIEGVGGLLAVEGDGCDAILHVVEEGFVLHDALLLSYLGSATTLDSRYSSKPATPFSRPTPLWR